ncbi:glycosyltransferase [Thermodesulfobacteriota bacterium]
MKILFFGYSYTQMSTSQRLHSALQEQKHKTFLLAWHSILKHVIIYKPPFFYKFIISKLKTYFFKLFIWRSYPNRNSNLPWTFNIFASNPIKKKMADQMDIIHLDWIANGAINLKALKKIGKPVVWTLHDVWPITGGCHCNLACDKWLTGCGACPQLGSHDEDDISAYFWKLKKKTFGSVPDLSIITPSKWLGNMAKKSQFFNNRKVYVIPNCIDTNLFKPMSKAYSRDALNIPVESKVILFGAVNSVNTWYKGFDLLIEALNHLKNEIGMSFHLVIFGASASDIDKINLPFPSTCLGTLRDEITLSVAYNCADVFVGPSRQDNFPNTFLEANACGVPCVGFSVGGIPEIVDHQKNGYIAKPFDIKDLANGITWVVEDTERYKSLSQYAREKAIKNYSMDIIAQKHIDLYKQLLS